jgi:hypothetical protein
LSQHVGALGNKNKKMSFDRQMIDAAHKHSIFHEREILESEICGCFHCLRTFSPTEITEWIDEDSEQKTAICPHCGIDSVIGSKSSYPITDTDFLKAMLYRLFQ